MGALPGSAPRLSRPGARSLFDDPARGWAAVAASLDAYGVRGREAAALRGDIRVLRRLYALQKKERGRARVARNGPRGYVPDSIRRAGRVYKNRRRHTGQFPGIQNWMFDRRSRGPCPLCHRDLPHATFPERKAHNYQVTRLKGLRQVWARLHEIRPWEVSATRGRERGLQHRIAVFTADAPHAARVLGPEGVRRVCAAYPPRQAYAQFRMWVRVHYGAGHKTLTRRARRA